MLTYRVNHRKRNPEVKENLIFRRRILLFGERSVAEVAGLYASRAEANLAASGLVVGSGFSVAQGNAFGLADGAISANTVLRRAMEPVLTPAVVSLLSGPSMKVMRRFCF